MAIRLIVNADDFGQSPGVNVGIFQAFECGIVTSASLMVRWPAALDAALFGQAHPKFSIGLHVDLNEWAFRDDRWIPIYEVVPIEDHERVAEEVNHQIRTFRKLMGRDPTHIDSHQHIHQRDPSVRSLLTQWAKILSVPLRHYSCIRYCGDFYGQTANGRSLPEQISVESLIKILKGLPPGITELGCHPAGATDLNTMYTNERLRELKALCDPRIREVLAANNIELCSFQFQ